MVEMQYSRLVANHGGLLNVHWNFVTITTYIIPERLVIFVIKQSPKKNQNLSLKNSLQNGHNVTLRPSWRQSIEVRIQMYVFFSFSIFPFKTALRCSGPPHSWEWQQGWMYQAFLGSNFLFYISFLCFQLISYVEPIFICSIL